MSDELEGVGEEANVLTPDRRELPRTPWTRNVRWRAQGQGFEGNGVGGSWARRTGWKCVRRWGVLNLGVQRAGAPGNGCSSWELAGSSHWALSVRALQVQIKLGAGWIDPLGSQTDPRKQG
jgi:hypothetical protein